jgi:hypothetical protein
MSSLLLHFSALNLAEDITSFYSLVSTGGYRCGGSSKAVAVNCSIYNNRLHSTVKYILLLRSEREGSV